MAHLCHDSKRKEMMSTEFYFRIKTKNPSRNDIYRYILKIFAKYQQVRVHGRFEQEGTLRRKRFSRPKDVEFEFEGYFENMSKKDLLKNIAEGSGNVHFNFGSPIDNCYLFDFYTSYSGWWSHGYFDYCISSPSVKCTPFFDFVDDLDGIFFDEEFIFGTICIETTYELEDQFAVFLKQGVTREQIPSWLHGIFDQNRFAALGDLLGNGIDLYLDKECQNEVESGKLEKYWFFDYFTGMCKKIS